MTMLCYNFLPVSLFLLFSSTFFSFSCGESHFPTIQTAATSLSGKVNEGKYDVGSWGIERLDVYGADGEIVGNSSNVLAAQRTYRRDPLNNFEKYDGGWNISEHHYWASVGFTAVPLFAVALVWFVVFGLCLSLICLCHFCCSREQYGYSRTAYALSLILLILFTTAAMPVHSTTNPVIFVAQGSSMATSKCVGSIILYIGQGKFHGSTTRTLEYVVHTADTTVDKLNNVSEFLSVAKQTGVDQVFLPANVQTDIDQIQSKINSSASTFSDQTVDNSDDIHDLLDSVRVALIVISAVMLLLTFLGFLFSILGMQFLVYILVIIGWILVTGTFILCGIFLLLHNVTADTCVAMNQWVQNPKAHTALDDILPCVDNVTAQETLLKSKEVTSQLVSVVNQVITNVSNINFSPNFAPFYFNQSGPLVPVLCDPFNSDMTDRACSAGEVDLDNATQVWSNFVCQVSATNVCVTTGRLTPAFYNQMSTAVNVSYGLYHYGPFLVDLQDCTFARQTFDDIYRDYCPGLRKHSKWIYFGLVMVSTAVMLSLLFWVIYGRERRHRVHTKRLEASHGFEGEKKIERENES